MSSALYKREWHRCCDKQRHSLIQTSLSDALPDAVSSVKVPEINAPLETVRDNILFFFFFSETIRQYISCEMSALPTAVVTGAITHYT